MKMTPRQEPVKCKARKQDGTQCRAWPIKGAEVCRVHGGRAPQVKAAAARRLAEQAAERAVRTLGLPVDVSPAEALLEEVRWTAGHVAWLRGKVQELAEEPTHRHVSFAILTTSRAPGAPALARRVIEQYQAAPRGTEKGETQ